MPCIAEVLNMLNWGHAWSYHPKHLNRLTCLAPMTPEDPTLGRLSSVTCISSAFIILISRKARLLRNVTPHLNADSEILYGLLEPVLGK